MVVKDSVRMAVSLKLVFTRNPGTMSPNPMDVALKNKMKKKPHALQTYTLS